MFVSNTYKDYASAGNALACALIGRTIIIISPFFTSNAQSNLSPTSKLNCFTMLIGTVVLNEAFFVAAKDSVVISLNQIAIIMSVFIAYIVYLLRGIFDYHQVYKPIGRYTNR